MKFLINMFNHSDIGQRSLEDVIGIIARQLRALGHVCEWSNKHFIEAYDGVNIIIEGFTPWSLQWIAKARKERGSRFVCIATEQPTPGGGFNHTKAGDFYSRQQIFPEAAQHFEAILSLVPGAESWYSQYAPTRHMELGYAPTSVRHQAKDPEYAAGFYGSISRRRSSILHKVERRLPAGRKGLRVVQGLIPAAQRDEEMRNTCVILQIRLLEKMGLVSSSRCATALNIGRPVIAEPHLLSKPWDEVVHFAKTEQSFLTDVVLYRGLWQGLFQKQFEKFRDIMSPERCVGRAIDELGVTRQAVGMYVPGFSAKHTMVPAGTTI